MNKLLLLLLLLAKQIKINSHLKNKKILLRGKNNYRHLKGSFLLGENKTTFFCLGYKKILLLYVLNKPRMKA